GLPVRLASGQVATEILDVCLPAGPVPVQNVEWEAALLDDEPRPLALRGEHSLDHGLVVGFRLHRDHEVTWGVADVDAPWALPSTGEARLHNAADLQVAVDRGDPADESVR